MLSKHLATMRISQQVSKCIFAKIKVEKTTTKANFSGMNRICEAFLAIFGWQRNKYLFFTHLNLYFTPHIRAKYYTHRRGAGMKVWVVGEQKKRDLIARIENTLRNFRKKYFGLLTPVVSEPFQHLFFFCWFSVHCRSYGAAGKCIYKTEFYAAIDFCRKFLVVDFNFFSFSFLLLCSHIHIGAL